jgi:hypothetical protein
MNLLEMEPIAAVRRHHAIEHATVTILSQHDPTLGLVGRSDTTGFNIYGDVDRNDLMDAARRAVKRLQSGESGLAIHPRCGTNFVVAGVLAALAAALVLGRTPRLNKLPSVVLATTFALFAAQPIGLKVQETVTTSPDARGARISGIRESRMGQLKIQHVDIDWNDR